MRPEMAVLAVQTAFSPMGNAQQRMAQERHKWILMNVNPAVKSMENNEKVFRKAIPMLFEDEFTKLAIETVD